MAITSISGKRAPRASAEDTSAFGAIAERFRRAGELERAVNLCRDGLQRFPEQVSARVTLGWALLELGKYDEAREELEQVLRRRPDNLAAIRALAELHDRSEQTLNLPMDGPGQWPPSGEIVDQAATNVADAVMALASDGLDEPVLIHSPAQEFADIVAATPLRDAAMIAPPALGLAMWSAMPEPEPEAAPEPSFGFMLNDRTEILAAAAAVPVQETRLPEVDLAALIAEADSLEAAAEADVAGILADPPMMVLESVDAETLGAADLDAAPVFTVPDARTFAAYAQSTPAYEVESTNQDPAVFQFQSTPAAAFVEIEELTAGVIEPELVVPPIAERLAELVAEPVVELEAESVADFVAPSFVASELVTAESTLVPGEAVEELLAYAPVEVEEVEEAVAMAPVEELVAVAPVEEPVMLAPVEEPLAVAAFDVEPVAEVVAGPRFELAAQSIAEIESAPVSLFGDEIAGTEAALELGQVSADQSALDFETVMAEPFVRAEVGSDVRRFPEPVPAAPAPVRALESFLARVQARRQHLMAESVA